MVFSKMCFNCRKVYPRGELVCPACNSRDYWSVAVEYKDGRIDKARVEREKGLNSSFPEPRVLKT